MAIENKHIDFSLLGLGLAMVLVGCKAQSPQSTEVMQASTKIEEAVQSPIAKQVEPASQIAPPAAIGVLSDIYKQPMEDSDEIKLSDGRYVSYWAGHEFSIDQKKYFLGISEATEPSEVEYPTEENKVNISQATYQLESGAWKLVNVQADVGRFGGFSKAPTHDTAQSPKFFPLKNGKAMLGMPSFVLGTAGTAVSFYEIFSFSATDHQLKYHGTVKAGVDNSAGCKRDQNSSSPIECATSTASLEFNENDPNSWPVLKVVFSGSAVNDQGKVVQLSDKDSQTYQFDEKKSQYLLTK